MKCLHTFCLFLLQRQITTFEAQESCSSNVFSSSSSSYDNIQAIYSSFFCQGKDKKLEMRFLEFLKGLVSSSLIFVTYDVTANEPPLTHFFKQVQGK